MTQDPSDELKRIEVRKHDALAEFFSATLLLREMLEAEEMEAVASLIERRETLIGVVDAVDRELAHARKIGSKDRAAEAVRETVLDLDLEKRLRQILPLNRDCLAIAADRLSLLSKELLDLHGKGEGVQGYSRHRHAGPIPKFLNLRT